MSEKGEGMEKSMALTLAKRADVCVAACAGADEPRAGELLRLRLKSALEQNALIAELRGEVERLKADTRLQDVRLWLRTCSESERAEVAYYAEVECYKTKLSQAEAALTEVREEARCAVERAGMAEGHATDLRTRNLQLVEALRVAGKFLGLQTRSCWNPNEHAAVRALIESALRAAGGGE